MWRKSQGWQQKDEIGIDPIYGDWRTPADLLRDEEEMAFSPSLLMTDRVLEHPRVSRIVEQSNWDYMPRPRSC